MSAVAHDAEARGLWIAVATYIVVFALKLAAYLATGVLALLAEAFHSLADIIVSGFLLAALFYSRREPDALHMFGHARAQNVAALVAATLFVSFTSLRLYEEAIPRLFAPAEAAYGDLRLAAAVLVAAIVLAAVPAALLLRQRDRGAAGRAQLVGLIVDELGLVAALIGTAFIALGWPIADPIASIVVATVVAWEGVRLFRENTSLLVGEAPDAATLDAIASAARAVPGVVGVHDLRAERTGPDELHAGLHVEVARGTAIEEADRIADTVRARVREATRCAYCLVQVETSRVTATAIA